MVQGFYFQIKAGISGNLLSTVTSFLKLRKQRVRLMLNSQLSSSIMRNTRVYSRPIVIFNLYKQSLTRPCNKCQALCRSRFSFFIVDNINLSATNLNSDLRWNKCFGKLIETAFQIWSLQQEKEVHFSHKYNKISHPSLWTLLMIKTMLKSAVLRTLGRLYRQKIGFSWTSSKHFWKSKQNNQLVT